MKYENFTILRSIDYQKDLSQLRCYETKECLKAMCLETKEYSVTNDYNNEKVIGKMESLKYVDGTITATIELNEKIIGYPCICGIIIEKRIVNNIMIIDKMELAGIGICRRNSDPEIKKIEYK